MAELCRVYEISRESGYKWMKRSRAKVSRGLKIAAEHRQRHPNQTDACVRAAVAAIASAASDLGPASCLSVFAAEAAASAVAFGQSRRERC